MILQVGAGTGLLYLVRWFWWRVNAWCEIVAMASSFAVSIALLVLKTQGVVVQHARGAPRDRRDHDRLLGGDGVSRARNRSRGADQVLAEGAAGRPRLGAHPCGWRVRPRATTTGPRGTTSRSRCSAGSPGCTAIWSALFAEGNYLYGRMPQAILLTGVFIVSGVVLIVIVKRIWASVVGQVG